MQRKHILQLICLSLWVAISSAPKAATEEVTVLLDWFINPDHAPLIVAEQEGLFENAGLTVKLVEPADPSLPPKLAAAKKQISRLATNRHSWSTSIIHYR